MRRILFIFALLLVCFVLQTSLFPFLELANVKPNLLLIVTISFALLRGQSEGAIIGFTAGLLIDIVFGQNIGLYALVFTCVGYGSGFFNKMFYEDGIALYIAIIAVGDLAYNLMTYALTFLLAGRLNVLFYLYRIMIPDVIYTSVIAICLFRAIIYLNDDLEEHEKRRVH